MDGWMDQRTTLTKVSFLFLFSFLPINGCFFFVSFRLLFYTGLRFVHHFGQENEKRVSEKDRERKLSRATDITMLLLLLVLYLEELN